MLSTTEFTASVYIVVLLSPPSSLRPCIHISMRGFRMADRSARKDRFRVTSIHTVQLHGICIRTEVWTTSTDDLVHENDL